MTIDPRGVRLRGATLVLTRAIHAQPPARASEDDVLAAICHALAWRGFKHAVVSPGRVDFGARRMFVSFGIEAQATSFLSGGTVHVADAGRTVRLELRVSPLVVLAFAAMAVWFVAGPFDAGTRILGLCALAAASLWTAGVATFFVGSWISDAVRQPSRRHPMQRR